MSKPVWWTIVILFCAGGFFAKSYAEDQEFKQQHQQQVWPCLYGPDGQPASTPCKGSDGTVVR